MIPACNCVALTRVVVREEPFHCTTEPAKNPFPLIRTVNPGPPATEVEGEIAEVGKGLGVKTLKTPPLAETAVSVPSGKTPHKPPIDIGIEASIAAGASVMVTTATAPLLVVVAFTPEAMHVVDAEPVEHVTVFPVSSARGLPSPSEKL